MEKWEKALGEKNLASTGGCGRNLGLSTGRRGEKSFPQKVMHIYTKYSGNVGLSSCGLGTWPGRFPYDSGWSTARIAALRSPSLQSKRPYVPILRSSYSYLELIFALISLMTSAISGEDFISFSTRSMECITVVWSRP